MTGLPEHARKYQTHWRVLDLDGWSFTRDVTITYDGDDEETIAVIERAAKDAGIQLERLVEYHVTGMELVE